MKYCSTILVGLLCTAACLAQTPLPESHRTSPEIFIYKPDARELRELHVKGAAPDEGMLHTFVGKYAAAEKIPQLPRGNYLRVWTDGNELVYSDHVVDNFYYRLVKDEQVMLILCDTLGNTIDDAVVKRGSKRMKYDPATRTYNLPRIRGEEATVEVNNDGVLHYITIANEPDYTYRPGFFKTAWGKVKTAFKRVFAPGKLPARDKYDGFVVFSKPRYKPGETVKFKAHYHRLDLRNFDGIAGIPGRALAGRPGEAPGYTLLDFFADSVRIREKPLGHAARTRHTVCLEGDPQILALPCDPPPTAPDYEGRMEYVLQDSAMVLTGAGCCGDMLYYGNSQGVLRAYDTRRGREVWRHRFPDALYTTPLCTDGLVIVGAASGGIWAFDARTGRRRWHLPTATAVVGDGLVDRSSLYIGLGVGSVGRIDLRSGKLLWRYDYGQGQAQGRPTLADGKLVFGAWDRHLYCLDAATGRCLWKWNNGHPGVFLSPGHVVPRIAGGKVFIVAPDRAVTCLDLATGRQLWRDNSRKARETTGLGDDGRQFYYKTMDGELAAVDTSADAYRETWCTDLGWGYEYNSCPACVRDGVVYVAGRLGQVAAVREDGTLLWSVKCCNSAGNDFRQAPDGSLWITFAEGKLFRIP